MEMFPYTAQPADGDVPADSDRWFVIEMLLGAHPFEELEAALLRVAVKPPESLLGQLREDERGLARAIKRLLPPDRATELVLVIDQLEELFTLTEAEEERQLFLDALCAVVHDPHSRVWVMVTPPAGARAVTAPPFTKAAGEPFSD